MESERLRAHGNASPLLQRVNITADLKERIVTANTLATQLEGVARMLPHINRVATLITQNALGAAGAQALDAGLQKLQRFPLSSRMLREVHAIMLGLDTAPHMPLKAAHALDELVAYMHESTRRPIVTAALLQEQFDFIKPFHDGHKRMRCIMLALFTAHKELQSHPLILLTSESDHSIETFVQSHVECAITT